MAVLHNIKSHAQIFVLKICTFPRLSSYCGQDLHECRTKYVEAVQQLKMSKIKSEPKFAECQNLDRSPTSAVQSKVSSVVVMADGVGVILALVETCAQVQLHQHHYSAL